jgi:hypothetical protein
MSAQAKANTRCSASVTELYAHLTASSHADPGAYWAMWGMGLVADVVVDEIHGYVDSMFP